jgi:hypothetical protein
LAPAACLIGGFPASPARAAIMTISFGIFGRRRNRLIFTGLKHGPFQGGLRRGFGTPLATRFLASIVRRAIKSL